MDNIDKNLNTLMHKIDSIDGGHGTHSNHQNIMYSEGKQPSNYIIIFAKKYFFFWSTLLFLIIVIIVLRPSSIYKKDIVNGKMIFSWSNFFVTLMTLYSFIILFYWIHIRIS